MKVVDVNFCRLPTRFVDEIREKWMEILPWTGNRVDDPANDMDAFVDQLIEFNENRDHFFDDPVSKANPVASNFAALYTLVRGFLPYHLPPYDLYSKDTAGDTLGKTVRGKRKLEDIGT